MRLPAPNPATDRVQLGLSSAAADADVHVVDALGRIVRALDVPERGQIEWNLEDAAANAVPSGVYWIRVRTQSGRDEAHRVVVTR